MGRYFGTDGIRGPVGTFVTESLAERVGRSLRVLACSTVVIGRDTRETGPSLAAAIARGALDAGMDVMLIAIVPTPLLSYTSARLDAIGVMITASHNPYQDNGIKVFLRGKKLFANEEAALEKLIDDAIAFSATHPGHLLPATDVFRFYRELASTIMPHTALKIALDFANGATFEIGHRLFADTGAQLCLTGGEPDGKNINLGVGSTHIEHLSAFVVDHGCDVGFAFDGDGDRLIAVGATGEVYDGDMLVYVIAIARKHRHLLKGDTVALTKMSNLGLVKALAQHDIRTLLTDVGDKYILEALEANDYMIGGENSGHIIDRTILNTGDGVLNALHVLKIMTETGQSLAGLTAGVHLYPDRLVNLKNIDKTLVNDPDVLAKTAEIASRLGSEGKILIRASGTEPLI
ncbi:MAG: phosphoglucosamine mutase, partial [bacterium]